jgi:TDG/mug DNA glycosylase family protein
MAHLSRTPAARTAVLPDVLATGLDVVFCGSAAGRKSAELRAYYAGPGNKFWPMLHEIGLTPQRIAAHDYRQLLRYKLGLTDLAKFVSGADAHLTRGDFCAESLRRKLAKFRPRVLAFTSKRAATEFFGHDVDYGLSSLQVYDALVFTLSSPSGLATGYWDQGRHWHELGRLVRSLPRARASRSHG